MALIGAIGALRLEADAGTDQLVDTRLRRLRATQDFKRELRRRRVVVLVKGDLQQLC